MVSTPPIEALTATLREATRAAHIALDNCPILAELSAGVIDAQRYIIVIAAFCRVWRALEQRAWETLIDRIPEVSAFEDPRYPLLEGDLIALRGAVLARAPKHAPAIGSGEQAAGTLYVLEGARLGGVLIADRLSKAGKPVGQPGFQFFGSAKAGIAERWRHFRAVIDSHDWSDKERERACVNAQATFMAISATLAEEQGHG